MTLTNSSQDLRPTHVVTCFLNQTNGGNSRILLVKRSQRVGSYHARWAGISGFVEEGVTPEEQAYTEIREETSLQADQVRLLKRGNVVEYRDSEIGRHWFVHPFLFEVLAPDRVQTDWEATDMRWIDPGDLSSYETVPRLQEAYFSALNGAPI